MRKCPAKKHRLQPFRGRSSICARDHQLPPFRAKRRARDFIHLLVPLSRALKTVTINNKNGESVFLEYRVVGRGMGGGEGRTAGVGSSVVTKLTAEVNRQGSGEDRTERRRGEEESSSRKKKKNGRCPVLARYSLGYLIKREGGEGWRESERSWLVQFPKVLNFHRGLFCAARIYLRRTIVWTVEKIAGAAIAIYPRIPRRRR